MDSQDFYKTKKKTEYSRVNRVCTKHLLLKWNISHVKIDLLTCLEEMGDFLLKQLEIWEPLEYFLDQIEDSREENVQITIRAYVILKRQCNLQYHTKLCFKGVVPNFFSYRSQTLDSWVSEYKNDLKDINIKRNYEFQY